MSETLDDQDRPAKVYAEKYLEAHQNSVDELPCPEHEDEKQREKARMWRHPEHQERQVGLCILTNLSRNLLA